MKRELITNFGGSNHQKEFIKETIEKRGSKDNDGLLRDILFALKEMNLKKDQRDDSKILHFEPDKGSSKQELFEMKMELKDL